MIFNLQSPLAQEITIKLKFGIFGKIECHIFASHAYWSYREGEGALPMHSWRYFSIIPICYFRTFGSLTNWLLCVVKNVAMKKGIKSHVIQKTITSHLNHLNPNHLTGYVEEECPTGQYLH